MTVATSTKYTTQEYDMVDLIAFKHYGADGFQDLIWQANSILSTLPMQLPQGIVLIIPVAEKVDESITLWE